MKNQGGFTLIELMVSLVIIGTLASIAVPMYSQHVEKSRVTSCQAEVRGYLAEGYHRLTNNLVGGNVASGACNSVNIDLTEREIVGKVDYQGNEIDVVMDFEGNLGAFSQTGVMTSYYGFRDGFAFLPYNPSQDFGEWCLTLHQTYVHTQVNDSVPTLGAVNNQPQFFPDTRRCRIPTVGRTINIYENQYGEVLCNQDTASQRYCDGQPRERQPIEF